MSAIVNALTKTLQADPDNWEIRQALIEAHLAGGDKDAAFELLHKIEALPEDESSLIAAAQCYALVGSNDDAKQIAQSVVTANPANADAHLALATIAENSGDSAMGLRHFITATSLNPALTSPMLQEKYGALIGSVTPPPSASASPAATPVEKKPEPELEPVAAVAEPEPAPTPEPAPKPEAIVQPEAADEVAAPPAAAMKVAAPPEAVTGLKTVKLQDITQAKSNILPMAQTMKLEKTPPAHQPPPHVTGLHVVAISEDETDHEPGEVEYADDGTIIPIEDMHLRERQAEIEVKRHAAMRRDKLASLTVTVLLHVGVFLALTLIVIAVPRDVPPSIVAMSQDAEKDDSMETTKVERTQVRPTSAASTSQDVISVASSSPIAISNLEFQGVSNQPSVSLSFEPSMSFGSASASMDSKMMFGQKIEGEVLGVILDVSGSMAEYLPMVIREVDKNFKNAPICYVNHGGMIGATTGTELYGIVKEEVTPTWTLADGRKVNSPYWFLWGDLPRKAPQKSVDRLIGIFKDRPNMFIARGGKNLIGAAAEFLIDQKCDSLYVFSDWEDFVDNEYCETLGAKLGRAKVKTYVQPAAARTDHLHTVTLQVANRTKGRELPPLTHLLRPDNDEQVSLLAHLEDEKKVAPPAGVEFATRRETRDGPGVVKNYGYWDGGDWAKRYGTELKVVEYPNFDLVMVGPEARAYIYLKTPEGYLQSPVIFGYHSQKPFLDSEEKTRYRRREWLRNVEEPTFDGKEFVWDMVLEDEIQFKVMFWFKEDTVTGTYIAEKPPEGQNDGAFIYFRIPPTALERKDMYYGVDFPNGLSLDDLRLAMTYNVGNFYLPALAADRMEVTWNRLGFNRGDNLLPYNVMYRTLPDAVREVTVNGPSFGPLKLQARTINNNLLLNTHTRADMELWEGFLASLVRPADRRERLSRAEAIAFSVEKQ